ncbi:hypothetical protein BGZ96_012311 [Linnemannia gamsii]|uniref:Uncharacterized protein n=1 Tax=Linnemannia gamsii TaxID=64522 RepID=A0ABQ7KBY2_9FUNG|nr:hypothetical protein BGZ96_012311 [Linnemannia gamsii]
MYLDQRNWSRFFQKVEETDLSLVKTIVQPKLIADVYVLDKVFERNPFLHRCRSLDTLDIILISGMFQWAVDERKEYGDNIAAGRRSTQPLVPLRELNVRVASPSDGKLISDVAYAFSGTLENLKVTSPMTSRSSDELTMDQTENHSFVSSLDEFMEIFDRHSGYPLTGAALATATPLICSEWQIWTWDWDLPKLTKLTLNAEFAQRFQFKMLQGTPSLLHFSVDSRSSPFEHKNTVDAKDFAKTRQGKKTLKGVQDVDGTGDATTAHFFAEGFMDFGSASVAASMPRGGSKPRADIACVL